VVALTQKLVDELPSNRDGTTWDDDVRGLGLRVQAGKRTWVVRYRVAGAQRQKSLPGALPLRKARQQAAEIITGARRGPTSSPRVERRRGRNGSRSATGASVR
jgi:hypothetical protein